MSSLFDKMPAPEKAPAVVVPLPERTRGVVIEPAEDGGFWVTRMRGDRTSASVHYTRAELEELQRRILPALEIG